MPEQPPLPIISVDRAIRHYVKSLAIDPHELSTFYRDLPFENKPPLENCRIHISALANAYHHTRISGVHLREGESASDYDPLAPKESNVIIFLGSMLDHPKPSQVLGHELVHYAQNGERVERYKDYDKDKRAQTLAMELVLLTNNRIKAIRYLAGTAMYGTFEYTVQSLIGSHPDPKIAALEGLGFEVLSRFWHRKKRHARQIQVEKELHKISIDHPVEQDARAHQQLNPKGFTFELKEERPIILIRQYRKYNTVRDVVHEQVSLGKPPPRRKLQG